MRLIRITDWGGGTGGGVLNEQATWQTSAGAGELWRKEMWAELKGTGGIGTRRK